MPFDPVTPLLGMYWKEPKTLIGRNINTPMFTAMLLTIAKIWKQPKCPSVDEWIKQLQDILHNGVLLGHKKEENITLCNSVDGHGGHYAK